MNKIAYRKFTGINNVDDPVSLIDRSRGNMTIPLVVATNIDIHKDQHLSRCDGYTKVISGIYTSVWSNDFLILGINNGNLVQIKGDYTITILMSGVGDYKMVYETVYDDTGMRVYFTNGMIIGKIKNGVASLLGATTQEFKSVLPPGDMLKYFSGRLYLIKDKTIYVSDVLNREVYDRRWGFKQIETTITMFEGLTEGIYVSDSEGVFWMKKIDEMPEVAATSSFAFSLIDNTPAIPGTAIKLNNIISPSGARHRQAVLWTSKNGLCLGGDNGMYERVLDGVYNIPVHYQKGASVFRESGDLNQYISILK